MNATERAALTQGVSLYEDLVGRVSDETLRIIDRRRSTATLQRRGWLLRRALVAADLLALTVVFIVADLLFSRGAEGTVAAAPEAIAFVAGVGGWIVVAKVYGLYDGVEERTRESQVDEAITIFHLLTAATWVVFAAAHVSALAAPSVEKVAFFWLAALVLLLAARAAARAAARHSTIYVQNAVIVGAGDVGHKIARDLREHPDYGINVVGFVDDEPKDAAHAGETVGVLGGVAQLDAIVRVFDIERVIIAFSRAGHESDLHVVNAMRDRGVQVDVVPRLFEAVGARTRVHRVEDLPLVSLAVARPRRRPVPAPPRVQAAAVPKEVGH